MEIHQSAEDYLEAILMIKEKKGYVRSIDVANQLGVSKPSVSYATKRLRENGYISFNEDGMISLTDSGMEIDELRIWAEEHKLEVHHWFFSTDLSFYVKGGRISKTAAFFGSVLEICPLLNMDNLGRLIPRFKIRTKKRVIKEIVKKMEEFARDGHDYDGKCYISQSACIPDAQAVAALVEEKFPKLNGKVLINYVGTTIGSHTGPGTVALFFWGSERVN